MSEHYITLSELLILTLLWLAPALIVASVVQVVLYRRWTALRHRPVAALLGVLAVIVVSPVIGLLGLLSGVSVPLLFGAPVDMFFFAVAFAIAGITMVLVLMITYGYHKYVTRS